MYFSFGINSRGSNLYADGLAFFLAPEGSRIPDNKLAAGGGLRLAIDSLQNTSRNHHFVAVEFDTFSNYFDPPGDHVGVNINSTVSVVNMTWFSSIPNNKTTDAWINYNSTSKNLSVVFTGYQQEGNTTVPFLQTLSYNIDLRDYLPEWVTFGFSGIPNNSFGRHDGYMAPECLTTGKASKETDVYSFGVVALEIACGRKPIDPKAEEHQVNIIDWVWRLYGMGNLREAVDPRLSSEFNEQEVEHLLMVGLWCAHPDNNCRPSIRQATQVLNFEAPLPTLPPNMPVPTNCSYGSPTSFTSPYDSNDPQIYEIHSSGTRDYTGSSNNIAASAASSPSASLLYTR
ncbi:hypothetical protein MTR67_044300 [Solanum verrucosum]|uniref:non-specific serine/threonine protein kinase n=1 Tax=Solanum verrucosum TaxID=315347 RepID=A0AAF0ZVI6_SOLVR|nr:hypothetical protein MTR67_044300 [Solanum verrucosum]